MERISWHKYFMEIAFIVSKRSTCVRRKVGAIATKGNHIISMGYNGAPTGFAHCLDIGCLRENLGVPSGQRHELCRAVHAEQNMIIQAATSGVSLLDSIVYCTTYPCVICMKMLINSKVKSIYFAEGYPDEMSVKMADESNINIIQMEN